ncbi:MAG: hypothetical protein MHPSP_000458, partial [Paramarteilia canceri]
MKHEDDVNRARIMPQNQNLIATKSPTRKVYIYDITKHPSVPAENDTKVSSADLTLIGHNQEGFALDWNSNSPGKILSGGDDSLICSWDVSKYDNRSDMLGKDVVASPSSVYTFHTSVISDVKWSLMHDSLFGSVSDDKILAIWDTRVGMQPQMIKKDAHDKEVNCLAFHPSNENFLLTGSSDQTIKLWDLRSPNNTISTFEQNESSENKNPLSKMSKQNDPAPKTMMDKQQRHIFQHHENSVYSVEWSPNLETVFASASTDSTVHLWQLDQIGAEQSAEDAQDGPPELMFIHGGHTAAVSDICWHIGEQLLLTSVAEDNIVHIWKMNSDILSQVGDDYDKLQSDRRGKAKASILVFIAGLEIEYFVCWKNLPIHALKRIQLQILMVKAFFPSSRAPRLSHLLNFSLANLQTHFCKSKSSFINAKNIRQSRQLQTAMNPPQSLYRLVPHLWALPQHYEVSCEPDFESDSLKLNQKIHFTVSKANNSDKPLFINGKYAKIHNSQVNNQPVQLNLAKDSSGNKYTDVFTFEVPENLQKDLTEVGKKFELDLNVDMKIKSDLEGAYYATSKVNGLPDQKLLVTQFESHFARDAFVCVDEPEAKATFNFKFILPQDTDVLFNTPPLHSKKLESGKIEHCFETTPILSTYLIAFAIGQFESHKTQIKNSDGTDIFIEFYCPKGNKDKIVTPLK